MYSPPEHYRQSVLNFYLADKNTFNSRRRPWERLDDQSSWERLHGVRILDVVSQIKILKYNKRQLEMAGLHVPGNPPQMVKVKYYAPMIFQTELHPINVMYEQFSERTSEPILGTTEMYNEVTKKLNELLETPEGRAYVAVEIQRMYRGRKTTAKEKLIQNYRDYLCEMSEDNQFTVEVPESLSDLKKKYGNEITLQCNPGSQAGAPWTIGQPLTHDEIIELYLHKDGPPLPEPRDIFGLSSRDFADQREINKVRNEISELKKELQLQYGGYIVRPIFY